MADEIILNEDDLHLAGQLAIVTAILATSGGLDQTKARAEGRRIVREAILDVHEIEDALMTPQPRKRHSKKR